MVSNNKHVLLFHILGQRVGGWLLLTERTMWGAWLVCGGGKRGDSYCEIPVEGNWNSIGVRSWLLPRFL